MRILIAEDDAVSRRVLEMTLQKWGHEVIVVQDGVAALAAFQPEDAPPLAILDWMMPGLDGVEVCRKVRQMTGAAASTYIILLTAKDGRENIVTGLDAGADDYLTKPFSPRELEMRVGALLRRGGKKSESGADDERIEVGDIVIDKRRHQVLRRGEDVNLTPLEFQILELLASEPGRAWSRNSLLDKVWSTEYEGYQRNIDPHINRLRNKLEDDPKNPQYVLTVRGVGYKLNEAL